MIVWEKKTRDEAIQAGINPELIGNEVWRDYIIEVILIGSSDYQIV